MEVEVRIDDLRPPEAEPFYTDRRLVYEAVALEPAPGWLKWFRRPQLKHYRVYRHYRLHKSIESLCGAKSPDHSLEVKYGMTASMAAEMKSSVPGVLESKITSQLMATQETKETIRIEGIAGAPTSEYRVNHYQLVQEFEISDFPTPHKPISNRPPKIFEQPLPRYAAEPNEVKNSPRCLEPGARP